MRSRYADPHNDYANEFDSWRDSQLPDHVHDCIVCGEWIHSCYLFILNCDTYDKEICEACRAKAVAAD